MWAQPSVATGATVLQSARARVGEYAAEVRALALQDQVTGALNRRGLERAAGEMESVLRGEDALARVGGDEFVALLPASGPGDGARWPPGWSRRSRPWRPACRGQDT